MAVREAEPVRCPAAPRSKHICVKFCAQSLLVLCARCSGLVFESPTGSEQILQNWKRRIDGGEIVR